MGELDLRGLKCPLPALMARKTLKALSPGETLMVLASDPLAVVDIPHMCHEEGHVLVQSAPAPDHHRFLIRRGQASKSGHDADGR
ncbi:MAG TPA: sulfurtransferase TusA family protein [Rhizomicrobium sp.]|jgi:tRNA 2-thiouridine synthesizing protein A|nr:sulfurtransferase TusA family protein [Rhizomicrobium sp.]